MSTVIDVKKLDKFNAMDNINSYFGEWLHHEKELFKEYHNATPFEHMVIDNFLNEDLAMRISEMYPSDLCKWHVYHNPIEIKYAFDKIDELNEELASIFYLLSTDYISSIFSRITDIPLQYDPYLHGGGVHMMPNNGRLGIHLDYEINPLSGKQRRLNVILYLTSEWKEEWNGHTELWNGDFSHATKIPVKFNSAIIFKTDDTSWHGVSQKIQCPQNIFRKSLAYYYMSDFTEKDFKKEYRTKATFICKPHEDNQEKLEELHKIRPIRRLTDADIEKYWPCWNENEF